MSHEPWAMNHWTIGLIKIVRTFLDYWNYGTVVVLSRQNIKQNHWGGLQADMLGKYGGNESSHVKAAFVQAEATAPPPQLKSPCAVWACPSSSWSFSTRTGFSSDKGCSWKNCAARIAWRLQTSIRIHSMNSHEVVNQRFVYGCIHPVLYIIAWCPRSRWCLDIQESEPIRYPRCKNDLMATWLKNHNETAVNEQLLSMCSWIIMEALDLVAVRTSWYTLQVWIFRASSCEKLLHIRS